MIENPEDYVLSSGIRKIVWRTEGEVDFLHALSLFTHKRMKKVGDHVIGGWLGDISSGAHIRPFMLLPMNRRNFLEKIFYWYKRFDDRILARIFAQEFLSTYLPPVKDAFLDSYGRFANVPNPTAHELWDLRNRQTRQTISSMPVDSHLFSKVRPFFDRSYLEHLLSMPIRWRIGQTLYKTLIFEAGPEIRDVPNSNTKVRLYGSPMLNFGGYMRSMFGGATRKIAKHVRSKSRATNLHCQAGSLASLVIGDQGIGGLVTEFVNSDQCDDSVFNRNGILGLLDEHYAGIANHAELICLIATWSAALEYFIYETEDTCPPSAEPIY
jgi:hypothetical protein